VDADSGQAQLFRAYLGSRLAVWSLALGASAAFLFGAWKGSVPIMVAGPAAVLVAVTGISWIAADRAAAEGFYRAFARSVGLGYMSRSALLELTPLLGAGTSRHLEHWMLGRLPGGYRGGVGHLVWKKERRDSEGADERHRFTVCVVDVEASLPLFHGVYLRPRRGLFPPYSDWLDRPDVESTELESAAFTERYELLLSDDQDPLMLRRLFSPTLVSWLAEHPLAPGFELRAGTLCVFVPRPLDDAGNLTFLIDAACHLAGRVVEEVEEERERVAH
jgi:hypothetical protein